MASTVMPDIVRLRLVHFHKSVWVAPGWTSNTVQDNGEGKTRIELYNFHTIIITPKRGEPAFVSWAGCSGVEWADCEMKGCAKPRGHAERNDQDHLNAEGQSINAMAKKVA